MPSDHHPVHENLVCHLQENNSETKDGSEATEGNGVAASGVGSTSTSRGGSAGTGHRGVVATGASGSRGCGRSRAGGRGTRRGATSGAAGRGRGGCRAGGRGGGGGRYAGEDGADVQVDTGTRAEFLGASDRVLEVVGAGRLNAGHEAFDKASVLTDALWVEVALGRKTFDGAWKSALGDRAGVERLRADGGKGSSNGEDGSSSLHGD